MPKAVRVHQTGGPEALELDDVDVAAPGAGEVAVNVLAAGVNYIDTYHRSGLYPLPTPIGIGAEGAGIVTDVGPGVTDHKIGDRVAWYTVQGSYAEKLVLPAESAIPVPDGVDTDVAAALLLQGVTAHYLVASTYAVQKDDPILVHAAAGGVGLLLVQLAKARGARVLATVSTPEKEQLAREAGADEVVGYEDFDKHAREFTGGEGMAAVYDGVGRTTFDASLASVRRRGYMVLYGAASGPVPPVDPQRLNQQGSVYLTRPTSRDFSSPEEITWRTGELFDAVRSGALSVRIGGRYPLSEARKAHEDLQGRKTTGKLLLIP
ncbi:quinone oxidoreductase family protein [Kibdelosporangium phytohabitans]|uniref:NADPH--quinone reductase n=1 Tax=Kibdelosporangium phytohabitans TaxID=860235 RepID=A0A0N9IIK1_9PSEU|nr:quinone oxidoreductase [Kibdelosporangium phytohabitans]ALG15322.1 NADPH--quinone reductase [Kibdelosporangium phytohabitans]MBE1462974.1 NADPH2:quinone reductase [Kibdelosporangium phytohabitans]